MHRCDRCGRTVVRPTASTRPVVIDCTATELQVVFPPTAPGPTTVTLANGAVVDVFQLGGLISRFCPAFNGGCICG